MPSKFAVFTAAGRLVRKAVARFESPVHDNHFRASSYELPSWAYRKAPGESVHRWHDLRPQGEDESEA